MTISGNLMVTAGTFIEGGNLTLNATAGTTTISPGAWLTYASTGASSFRNIINNGVWNNSSNAAINVVGNLTNNGTFNTGSSSTYTFTGTGKTISSSTSALTIPNAVITGTVSNNCTVGSGLVISNLLSGAGTLTQIQNGILTLSGSTTTITGLDCSANPNSVVYNGAAAQNTKNSNTQYNNLTIAPAISTVVVTLGAASSVTGNLTVTSGTFSDGSLQLTGPGSSSGTLSLQGSASLQIGTAATATTFPVFMNSTLPSTSNVIYGASSAQNISIISGSSPSYGNLILSNASNKSALGALSVTGNLLINAGTLSDAGNIISVNGNVTNNGTCVSSGSGEILIAGGVSAHTITTTGTSVTSLFGNIEIADAAYPTTFSNASATSGTTNVNGSLTLTNGTLFVNSFTSALAISGTTNINSGTQLNINNASGTKSFNDLNVNGVFNNSINSDVTLIGNLVNNGTITAGAGTYTLSGANKTITGTNPNLTFLGAVTETGSITNNLTGTTTIGGILSGAGTYNIGASNSTLILGGGATVSTLNCMNGGTTPNTVIYNNASANVTGKGTSYSNLTISPAAYSVIMNAASAVNGNLSVTSGTLSDGGFQITGNGSGTLNVANGACLTIGTNGSTTETFPTSFTQGNIMLGNSSTVVYGAAGAQTISATPATYGNLTVAGLSVKTAATALSVTGNLNISAGTLADGGGTITVNGSVNNTGVHTGAGNITPVIK